MSEPGSPFLTAEWRDLVILDYEVPADVVEPLVPSGTELDRRGGALIASLVGFRFTRIAVLGRSIPGHRNVDEVNLRFYVRSTGQPDRRGVVFVRELVPRRAIAWVARLRYNEPYRFAPISHRIDRDAGVGAGRLEYAWRHRGRWYALRGEVAASPESPAPDSEAAFVVERHWGYTRQRDGGTLEYRVDHPRWAVAPLTGARFEPPDGSLYGPAWAPVLSGRPRSAFYAVGSAIVMYRGRRLETAPDTA